MENRLDKALDRLAEQVLAGEAIFFVGAGFSLASEGNSTKILVARLLARYDGFLAYPKYKPTGFNEDDLFKTFTIKPSRPSQYEKESEKPERYCTLKNAEKAAEKYYEFNDWMCTVFGLVARELFSLLTPNHTLNEDLSSEDLKPINDALEDVGKKENDYYKDYLAEVRYNRNKTEDKKGTVQTWRRKSAWLDNNKELRYIPIKPLSAEMRKLLLRIGEDNWGKVLFLDTLGFADEAMMAGCPFDNDQADPDASDAIRFPGWREGPRPRHFVLARLAREGLANVLLTTNFDLLLASAYRLTGLHQVRSGGAGRVDTADGSATEPSRLTGDDTLFSQFATITGPGDFFSEGRGYHTALIVKIHGCACVYRRRRRKALEAIKKQRDVRTCVEDFERYLSSIVFTYREVQHWRDAAWSRDLLNTLLRTRTMVLCGYSGQDPVIHDTFRTVYEGMRRVSRGNSSGKMNENEEERACEAAPAYYLGIHRKRGFYGTEILRAATAIHSYYPSHLDHPNYLEFAIPDIACSRFDPFPDPDDLMLWLYHRVIRERQAHYLKGELAATAGQLLGRGVYPDQIGRIIDRFDTVRKAEGDIFGGISKRLKGDGDASRDETLRAWFRCLVGWTWDFHPAFLQATAQRDRRVRRRVDHSLQHDDCTGRDPCLLPTSRFDPNRRHRYYPMFDQPGWATWGVVLELALRSLCVFRSGQNVELLHRVCGYGDDPNLTELLKSPPPACSVKPLDNGVIGIEFRENKDLLCPSRLIVAERPSAFGSTSTYTGGVCYRNTTFWYLDWDTGLWPTPPGDSELSDAHGHRFDAEASGWPGDTGVVPDADDLLKLAEGDTYTIEKWTGAEPEHFRSTRKR